MLYRIAILIMLLTVLPSVVLANNNELTSSSYWSDIIHEENSIVASVLYIPVMVFQVPIRLIDGALYPKPTSYSTVPPAAHQTPPVR
jgi:hypothetical protein